MRRLAATKLAQEKPGQTLQVTTLVHEASRDGGALLTNIFDPNRYVPPNYMQYVAIDKSGSTVSSLLSAETATSITLSSGQAAGETLLRANVDELTCTGQSLMQEGFERNITRPKMADLIAFLCNSIERQQDNDGSKPDIGTPPGLVEPQR